MIDGLIPWLRAQLDERQERAERAQPGPWAVSPSEMPGEFVVHGVSRRTGRRDPARVATTHGLRCAAEDAEYIADQDPDFVLREVEAIRKIVGECENQAAWESTTGRKYPATTAWALAVTTLRVLALPYADRPGYREEWKP